MVFESGPWRRCASAVCMSSLEEARPLRELNVEEFDLDDLRRRARSTELELDEDVEEKLLGIQNRPWFLVVYCIAMACVNGSTVAGAYFFLIVAGDTITPRCYAFHDHSDAFVPGDPNSETWSEHLCNISTFCFWTYPVIGPLVVVFVFWKNLLDARLYYECLMNKILLDFRPYAYVYSPTFWFIVLYGLTACCSLIYIKSASASKGETYRDLIYGLLAYFTPVGVFLFVLFSEWTVDWNVVSLHRYCHGDKKKAADLLSRGVFVPEDDFIRAYEAATDLLVRYAEEKSLDPVELTTPEFFRLVLDAYEKGAVPPSPWCSCLKIFNSYWVNRVIFCKHLRDPRSRSFRSWSWIYTLFIVIASLAFIWTMVHTAQDLMLFQRAIPGRIYLGPSPIDIVSKRQAFDGSPFHNSFWSMLRRGNN